MRAFDRVKEYREDRRQIKQILSEENRTFW